MTNKRACTQTYTPLLLLLLFFVVVVVVVVVNVVVVAAAVVVCVRVCVHVGVNELSERGKKKEKK